MIDSNSDDVRTVDAWASRNRPDILIADQLSKFSIGGDFSRSDERYGELFVTARSIAKKYDLAFWALHQCSNDGEKLGRIDFSMLAGAKTAIAAEADIVLGIGRPGGAANDNPLRLLVISKNKINGFHGEIPCVLDQQTCTWSR